MNNKAFIEFGFHRILRIQQISEGVIPRGLLPYKRLMGSHFHDCIDHNGVAFLVELLEWGRTFSRFLG